jgi:hypothetical protein
MAEGGGISYRIELDSSDAEQALQKLQSASEGLLGSLEKMASAVEEGGLGALSTLLEAAAGAVAGLTASLFGMAKASAETVDELGKVAEQTGSTVEQMSTLKAALGEFGANTDTLGRAFQRMGNTIENVWPGITKSVAGAANTIANDQIRVEKATQDVTKAQLEWASAASAVRQAYLSIEQAVLALGQAHTELERNSRDAAQQEINDALGIAGARQSVRNAEIALAQARGVAVSQETLQTNKIEQAQLALVAARQRQSEAETKASRDAEDGAVRREQLQLKELSATQALADAQQKAMEAEVKGRNSLLSVHEAQLKLSEARDKQLENESNSIDNLKSRIDALAHGMSSAIAGISVDNFIKGLVASVGDGVTALEGMGGSFGEITAQAPELRDVVLKLADAFKNMTDGAQRMAVATKLFGRKDAKDMVESLKHGSAALIEVEERTRSLGLEISKTDEVISKKFVEGMHRLSSVIGIVSTQFGLLFQPSFTRLLDSWAEAMGKNRAATIAWGQAIADTVGPVIESFARALAGTAVIGKDDWAVSMITGIKLFGAAASIVINGVVILFRGLLQMAEGVAFGINKVFGTTFNGLEILMVAFFTRMAFAFASLLLGMGPVGLAIIGVGLAVGLLITYWPQLTKAAQTAWEIIKADAEVVRQFIQDWVTTPVANAWKWIKDTWTDLGTWFDGQIEEIKALITTWVTTPVDNAWQWIKDKWNTMLQSMGFGAPAGAGGGSGHAAGGLLGGRGSGTSDSNLAWVSRGEYITPARAVAQPGVLAFLEALRHSGGNLRDVLDGMGRFALGGLVHAPIAIPAFAGGGMNHVTIQFPGLPPISGLRASSDVVDELRRSAALAQVRSGGRKPSRYS